MKNITFTADAMVIRKARERALRENTSLNEPTLSSHQNDTPYMLKLIKSSRRFTTRVRADDKTEVRYGAGVSDNPDEVIIPNPDNVGSALGFGSSFFGVGDFSLSASRSSSDPKSNKDFSA